MFFSCLPCALGVLADSIPQPPQTATVRVVHVIGAVSDDELTAVTVNIASARPDSVVLIDSPKAAKVNEEFLAVFKPTEVVPVGRFPDGVDGLATAPRRETTVRRELDRVVSAGRKGRRLPAAAAAPVPARRGPGGALRAPLVVVNGEDDAAELKRRLADWKTDEVIAVGKAAELFPEKGGVRVVALPGEAAVSGATVRRLLTDGPVENLIVANPADAGTASANVGAGPLARGPETGGLLADQRKRGRRRWRRSAPRSAEGA